MKSNVSGCLFFSDCHTRTHTLKWSHFCGIFLLKVRYPVSGYRVLVSVSLLVTLLVSYVSKRRT